MKRFILILSILFVITNIQAQVSSMYLGYCNGEVAKSGQLGISEATTVETAIYLPADELQNHVGNKIETIRAGLASKLNLTELTVWVRSELEGVNLAEATAESIKKGWNDISLPIPYEISGNIGLYIGYTIVQKGAAFGISSVGVYEENSLFIKLGSDQEWQSPNEYGVASIEAIVTGNNLPKFDLKLESVSIVENYPMETAMKIAIDVRNAATQTITGFDVECMIENTKPIETHINCNLEYNVVNSFEFEITPDIHELKEGVNMTITIKNLTEGEDQYMKNNSQICEFNVINKVFERNLIIEEFTTEQCSACPYGAEILHGALDILNEEYTNQLNVICHHAGFNTDWLTLDASQNLLWLYGGSTYAPAFMADRTGVFENPGSVEAMAEKLRKRLDKPSYVGLELDATYDEETKKLSVSVAGERSMIFCENPPRITIYLTENNIKAHNQQGYGTEYIHNHVLRAHNDPWGWGEEIVWNDDNTFEYEYEFSIKDKWITNNMEIIAFVGDYDSEDISNFVIENSIMHEFTDFYYDSINDTDFDNIQIKVNGNNIIIEGENIEYSIHSINGVQTKSDNLPPGIYIVNIKSNNNSTSHKFIIK